jgi:hypothetical protein
VLGCVTDGGRAVATTPAATVATKQQSGSSGGVQTVTVREVNALREAVAKATPGTRIRIAPGEYTGGLFFSNVRGTKDRPIVIEAEDAKNPPVFGKAGEAMHFSEVAYLELRNLTFSGLSSNGLNIDDGGSYDTPSHHVTLYGLTVRDVGPSGNHDTIKLSGLDDFRVENCLMENWGTGSGCGIDMVGCHRGVITGNVFRHKTEGETGASAIQCKGGTSEITISGNRFINAGTRGVNIGGSTGLEFFRPVLSKGANGENRIGSGPAYEAKNIIVEDNVFHGGQAAVAFVGVDGATVRNNVIYRPGRWAMRILQETTAPGFAPSRNGVFADNIIVFNAATLAEGGVNIGPSTAPGTFRFSGNVWYAQDNAARSRPTLPASETGGIYGQDPLFTDSEEGDFTLRANSPVKGKGIRRPLGGARK